MTAKHGLEVDIWAYQGWLFDLDGVLTNTAEVHAAAWKQAFDEFLAKEEKRADKAFAPFDPVADYHATSTANRGPTVLCTSWPPAGSNSPRAPTTILRTPARSLGSATGRITSSCSCCAQVGSMSTRARSRW